MRAASCVCSLLLLSVAGQALSFEARPNIVLIMADDFGYECVGANGCVAYATPRLDELARTGMRFEHCHVQPLCTPTRVQLMTGQYNDRNYIRFGILDPAAVTFANLLQQAGYKTCIAGKWQLLGEFAGPTHFGFDEYCLWQLNRRPSRYANPGLEVNGRRVDYVNGEYGPDLVQEYACEFMTRHKIPTAASGVSLGYGLTECGGLCTTATNEMLLEDPTCAGRPLATAEIAILDDDGKALPDGEVGHVCIRGPMVMPGYYDNPEATAAAFFPGRWLNSGDYGRMVDGMLYLESRKRDMIIRGGENIYPIEIENRLEEHPDVLEAAVIGVDHRTLGQEVKAVVVPRAGRRIDVDDVKQFVGATLAYYKVPAHVDVRHEPLPRNATGKVMKHVLSGEAENTFVEE